jgi:hypothetical protein
VKTTQQTESPGGTVLNTTQMTGEAAVANMTGFDFSQTWQTQSDDYPALSWASHTSGDSDQPSLDLVTLDIVTISDTIETGYEHPATLTARNISNGIGSYEMSFQLTNEEPVAFADIIIHTESDFSEVSVGPQNNSVTVQVAGIETPNTSETIELLQTVALATADGQTEIRLTNVTVSTENGFEYPVRVKNQSVTVTSLSPVTGEDPPRDPDGDGLYEDVNGDGEIGITDVQAFFKQYDSVTVRNNSDKFDFNNNGEVNIADVQRLFYNLTRANS